jgi:hypothetical protein
VPSHELRKPIATRFWFVENGGIIHYGHTRPHHRTTSGLGELTHREREHLHLLDLIPYRNLLDLLPADPEDRQVLVPYRINGHVVLVRDTIAKDSLIRDTDTIVRWLAGERVRRGTVRSYQGIRYRCIRRHRSTPDRRPPNETYWRTRNP